MSSRGGKWGATLRLGVMALLFGVAATIAAEEAGRLAAPAVSEPIDRRYLGQEVAGWEAPLVARVETWAGAAGLGPTAGR